MNINYELVMQNYERLKRNKAVLRGARFRLELLRSTETRLLSFLQK